MRNCPYCKIQVGGNLKKCPLCQSKLVGEKDAPYFPKQTTLKIQSFFYKIQLFIVWTIIIVALGLDFLFGLKIWFIRNIHWSLIIAMWLFVAEFGVIRLFKKGISPARIMTLLIYILLTLLTVTTYSMGQLWLVKDWVAPCTVMATLIANFVLAMIDKNGNAMVYLLTNSVVGILPYIVFYLAEKDCPMTWIICLLVSVVLFVGAIVFKGREVVNEIQRRLSV